MASSRVLASVLLLLGVVSKSYETRLNAGNPIKTVETVTESSLSYAQLGQRINKLKLHIDQSIEYLWNRLEPLLESVQNVKQTSCGSDLPQETSVLQEKLHALLHTVSSGKECMQLAGLQSDIKAIREGQRQVSERLFNVSASREIKVARLKYQLLEASLGVKLYRYNPDGKGAFIVKSCSASNHLYGDGWIVFQQRYDGSISFNRTWAAYREGFGEWGGEYWLGLEKLHRILSSGPRFELLIELEGPRGVTAFQHYNEFLIGDESENYELKQLGSSEGTAGDSLQILKGNNFTTYDHYATHNCPTAFWGGWWFDNCNHT
uniref:Fibrinogen C-terminal domain-containing protein n=1 Tax=Anopheles epiroticus TaxID=199890 RepID=A0A182PQP5_9DIPT